MDDRDVLTADFPSRLALEEEEEQLQEVARHYSDPPSIEISHEAGASACRCSLVVACGRGPEAVARHACSKAELLGTVVLPRLATPPHLGALPGNVDRACQLMLASSPSSAPGPVSGEGPVVVALVPQDVPPERCHAWVTAVLGLLQPVRVLVLTVMQGQDFRGPADPSEEALVFAVETRAAAGAAARAGLPLLPSGHLLGGLPAALLTSCQLNGKPCAALAAVQPMPVPDAKLVHGMAAAAAAMTKSMGVPSDELALGSKGAVSLACRELDNAFVSSAAASMYA